MSAKSLPSKDSVTVSREAYDNLRGRAERYAVRVQELAAERDRYRDALNRYRDSLDLLEFHHDISDGALRCLRKALDA